ncbi:MAG: TolC family outer membrane protein [Pseudomonadales bacterium]
MTDVFAAPLRWLILALGLSVATAHAAETAGESPAARAAGAIPAAASGSVPAAVANPLASPKAPEVPASGVFPENTLAGVYELALDNDLQLERARAELRVGQEIRRIALAGLLPQAQAGVSRIEAESEQKTTFVAGAFEQPYESKIDTSTGALDVSLRQPLFDLSAWFSFRRGQALSEQAETTFAVAQQNLMVRAVTAYTAVLRAASNVRASRAQEQAFTAQLDQVQQRFDVGMVAITDVHEARAAYDLAVAQRVGDEGRLGTAREQLSLLTGRPHGDLWELGGAFPVSDPDPVGEDAWVSFALANNLDIQAAALGRDAARGGARAAASEHLPRLDLTFGYADSSTDVDQTVKGVGRRPEYPNDQERTTVALNLTVPIYSGGYISANRRQAAAQFDAQQAGYDLAVRTVTQETRALHIQVRADVATRAARAQAVTSTKSALEAAEVGYEVGTRNVVDVLNAQREHFSAVRDYANSTVDYVQDLFFLKRLTGTLSPGDIYELNRWLVEPPPASLSGAQSAAPSAAN